MGRRQVDPSKSRLTREFAAAFTAASSELGNIGSITNSEEAPLFVKVTLLPAELVFIVWGGKFMELGVNVSNGPLQLVQPVPVIVTNCALVGSLSCKILVKSLDLIRSG
jgi:hypothetical protein